MYYYFSSVNNLFFSFESPVMKDKYIDTLIKLLLLLLLWRYIVANQHSPEWDN